MNKFKLACDNIERNWEDELIEELWKHPKDGDFKKYFCHEFTKICQGVNLRQFFDEQIAAEHGFTPEDYHKLINDEPLERPPNSDL